MKAGGPFSKTQMSFCHERPRSQKQEPLKSGYDSCYVYHVKFRPVRTGQRTLALTTMFSHLFSEDPTLTKNHVLEFTSNSAVAHKLLIITLTDWTLLLVP